jgi:two-component system OmpR family sensor kinase
MHSLRRTVAVRFSLTIFGALLVIALWAYLGTRRVLEESLDQNLAAAAQLEQAVLAARLPIAIQPGPDDWDSFIHRVNRFVVIRDPNGRVVETNTAIAAAMPMDRVAFTRALRGDTAWVSQQWLDGSLRSIYVPAPPSSREGHDVLQIAASLHPLRSATREVLFLMLGTVFLGAVATAIGAGWLAQTSVAPVLEITRQARSVAPRAGQRITAHADTEEFTGLVAVLNDAFSRLERAFEAQRRMIADAAHDLRTPLTAMRGELEVALRGVRSPDNYRNVLRSVLEEVDQLTAISESLTLLARLEAGELAVNRVEQDVTELLREGTDRAAARDGSHSFEFRGPDDTVTASVDGHLLGIAIGQLLDNTIKHTPPGCQVLIGLDSDANEVTITVDDNGPGIADEVVPHLFEHFYRSDEARTRTGSVGLGLTISAAIAQAHGGEIAASRSPMGGLRITLWLPRASGHI